MDEEKIIVPEEGAENTEGTAEEIQGQGNPAAEGQGNPGIPGEPEKVYTEEEFQRRLSEAVDKRVARREAKIRKEYDQRYGTLEDVLLAGTGKKNVEEVTEQFRGFYEGQGVKIPARPAYSDRDTEVLAQAEAEEIIRSGMDEVVEEVDRLAAKGSMSPREKLVFRALAGHRKAEEQKSELRRLGVPEEVYGSREFADFAAKFSRDTPVSEVYGIYSRMQPKKETRTMGSMKNSGAGEPGVKEFYTRDEAMKFTRKDFDRNPELFRAVEKSMLKWK